MFSILDILKKQREEKKKQSPPKDNSSFFAAQNDLGETIGDNAQDQASGYAHTDADLSISCALSKEASQEHAARIAEIYETALALANNIYQENSKNKSALVGEVKSIIAEIVGLLTVANKSSLRVSLADYANKENYLGCHALNVCLLSVEIGLGLGYDSQRLNELGQASLLHDLGMLQCLNIINKSEKLTPEEFALIKEHPKLGLKMICEYGGELPESVSLVIAQEHERSDGCGYPNAIKEADTAEFAQIVGLIDVYEALTHSRPYRNKYTPLEAISLILKNKNAFAYRIVKSFLETIGIFPVGSIVLLNTREVGVVVKENLGLPLRPVVNIMQDMQNRELKSPKQINLASFPMIFIEKCLHSLK